MPEGASATLPLSWYFDPRVLAIERRTVLAAGPDYVGCTPMLPAPGSFHTLAQRDHAEVLVREGAAAHLLSNVCLHRGMLIVQGSGTARALVCSMHRWSYGLDGTLRNAPLYPETPCRRLAARPLQRWNGILFAGAREVAADLAFLGPRPDLDISGYVLDQVQAEEQAVNWKIPIEIGLENYHAPFTHPGYARYTTRETWYENDGARDTEHVSFQEMKPAPNFDRNAGSPVFEAFQRAILKINGGAPPRFGVAILIYYPNTFFEWWPYAFEATTYTPLAAERTLMTRQILFDPRALEIVPEYPDLFKAAWFETQAADDAAQRSMHRGRAARHRLDPEGPSGYEVYQAMEESTPIFLRRLADVVRPHLRQPAIGTAVELAR
jgi:phenylpropionate dioxygenase-like ring-hydroxylating dioxygenase large terminal subunit